MQYRLTLLAASQFSVGSVWQNIAVYGILLLGFLVVFVQLNPHRETGVHKRVILLFKGAGRFVRVRCHRKNSGPHN